MHLGSRPDLADRRRWARANAKVPCKARLAGDVRFAPGVTHDLSAGGAFIELRTPRAPEPGECVEVLLAPGSEGVVEAKSACAARIVRAERLAEDTWRVAVAYDRAAALAA